MEPESVCGTTTTSDSCRQRLELIASAISRVWSPEIYPLTDSSAAPLQKTRLDSSTAIYSIRPMTDSKTPHPLVAMPEEARIAYVSLLGELCYGRSSLPD